MARYSMDLRQLDRRLGWFQTFAYSDLESFQPGDIDPAGMEPEGWRAWQLVRGFVSGAYFANIDHVGTHLVSMGEWDLILGRSHMLNLSRFTEEDFEAGRDQGKVLISLMQRVQPLFKDRYEHLVGSIIKRQSPASTFSLDAQVVVGHSDETGAVTWRLEPRVTEGSNILDQPVKDTESMLGKMVENMTEKRDREVADCLMFALVRQIGGLSLDGFKQCPHCGQFFIVATDTQKIYCSKNCGAVARKKAERARKKKGG